MTVVRVKGLKRYRSKGRWYAYHRASGQRIDAVFGSAEFFVELDRLNKRTVAQPRAGTLGGLFTLYRSSTRFRELASATREGYSRIINLLAPMDAMPVAELTPPFVAQLRDKMADKHGRRQANYVMAVISVACEHGREHGILRENPVKGIRRLNRDRSRPQANRPWTADECRTVLHNVPQQLKIPIALAMFTGLRKGDVLRLSVASIREGRVWRRTSKTGHEMSIPLHPELLDLLKTAKPHDAGTLVVNSWGRPWTDSGFNSTFVKEIGKLEAAGKIGTGLTFHGLRHTVGTLLITAGFDIDTVRRWLGQRTLAMAIHYTESANVDGRMTAVIEKLDPLGTKKRTQNV